MFDLEREQLRKTYQICRIGFAITAVALVLACFYSLLSLYGRFDRGLDTWIRESGLGQWIDAPIVWGCLIGATLLWGRWDHVSWQRRAGLFLVMNLVDVVLWFIAGPTRWGPRLGEFGHEWLRISLGTLSGGENSRLLSSLACDYLTHLGVEHARESDKSTRSMAATGAMVWLLYFCQHTNWRRRLAAPIPPGPGARSFLVFYGYHLIWTITLIQVTALVVSAVRQSTTVLEEIERDDQESDLLAPRSEPLSNSASQRDDAW